MTSLDVPMPTVDHVIASFDRERLSGALASTHRAGFGPQTKVLDGARLDTATQLQRAGLEIRAGFQPASDAVLIVVTAPGRTSIVVELFQSLGASAVALAGRRDEMALIPRTLDAAVPDIRIGSDSATGSEP